VEESASFGEYRLRKKRRSFGLFAIYEAQDARGRPLWLAVAAPGILPDSKVRARLSKAADTLARLRSDTALQFLHLVEVGDAVGLLTEAPPGPELNRLMADKQPSYAELGAVIVALAFSVHALHRDDMVGLMLSRESVFVANGRIRVSLLEAVLRSDEDDRGAELPTRGPDDVFAAPERRRGEKATVASDVYSVARLGWDLLGGPALDDRAKVRLGEGPPDVELPLPPNVGFDRRLLERCLLRALDRTPSLRHSNAKELALELAAALNLPESGHAPALFVQSAGVVQEVQAPVDRLTRTLILLSGVVALVALAITWVRPRDPAQQVYKGKSSGQVKLLAEPWAEVFLGGERVDVTPFATPLELPPGKYEFIFRHPAAPEERRSIELAPGARVTIDVEMRIPSAAPRVVEDTP
jgi:serine/threonine-protein kinase